jgi:hypothetical protein
MELRVDDAMASHLPGAERQSPDSHPPSRPNWYDQRRVDDVICGRDDLRFSQKGGQKTGR